MNINTSLIEPLKNFCRVSIPSTEIQTSSGVSISEAQAFATPVMGTVLKAGAESKFKEGDILFFRRYSVDELRLVNDNGEESVYFVNDGDVIGTYSKQ